MFIPMFNVSICYLFMLFIQMIISATPCIYDLGNGQQLDIRPLGLENGKGPKYDNIPNSIPIPYTFSWNGCFDYSKSGTGNCKNAAACYTNTNNDESTLIATQTEAIFEHHGDINLLVYEHDKMQLTVLLICRDMDGETINGVREDQETFNIHLESRCCCPGKCKYTNNSNGISGGAVFVILLVVLLFVYFVGGVIFLKFSRGATGSDMIPNRLLWTNIVGYTVGGFQYSTQVIRQRSFSVEYSKI